MPVYKIKEDTHTIENGDPVLCKYVGYRGQPNNPWYVFLFHCADAVQSNSNNILQQNNVQQDNVTNIFFVLFCLCGYFIHIHIPHTIHVPPSPLHLFSFPGLWELS